MPFVVIGLIVGGAMFFLNDSYKEEFDPGWSQEQDGYEWNMTVFLEDVHRDVPEIGVRLERHREDVDIEAIEFFFETGYGGFYYQDLDVNQQDGVFTYTEDCDFCQEADMNSIPGTIMINWKESGLLKTEHFSIEIVVEDEAI